MKKNSMYNFIFFLTYTLLLISSLCVKVKNIELFLKLSKVSMYGLLIILILIQSKRYSLKSFGKIIILCAILSLVLYNTGDSILLITLMFSIVSKNINSEEFIKKDFLLKLILIIIVLILYKIGLAENVITYRIDGTMRESLGFSHPNSLGLYIFSLCADLMYLHYGKYKIKDYIF